MSVLIKINNKSIDFSKKGNSYFLPVLNDHNKLGTQCFWEIWVTDNNIFRKSYQLNGKERTFPPIVCSIKNAGKKNETNPHEQALLESYSLWTKKQCKGFSIESTANSSTEQKTEFKNILPMLANKYSDRKKYLKLPFAVSPKIDGVRVTAQVFNDEIKLSSRTGKEFNFLDNIRLSLQKLLSKHPHVIIDGELYSHDLPFNAISGSVRSTKQKSKFDDQIQLWIFDLIDTTKLDMSYKDRMKLLSKLEKYSSDSNLRFIYYDNCENHDNVTAYHDKYVSDGYEGLMCRNLDSSYLFKNRSNDLLKFKSFEDNEFTIIGAKEGSGTEKGAIIFECTTGSSGSGNFDVRPRGSFEKRIEMFNNKSSYIGKKLTVRYQATGEHNDTGIPRFPVGIDVRDYE